MGISKYIRNHNAFISSEYRYVLILCILSALYFSRSIVTRFYLRGWDAPTHIFFASGYLKNWWSVWDIRWYGGYSKTTYPPLAHQVVALTSKLMGNMEVAYGLVLWLLLVFSPVAVYSFSKAFVDPKSSLVAAFLFVITPTARIMLFSYGQFSGFVCILFVMFAVGAIQTYSQKLRNIKGISITFLVACSLASHHLGNIFFLVPSLLFAIFAQAKQHRSRGFRNLGINTVIKPILFIALGVFISLPFIAWMFNFEMQTPIPHPSRTNFFNDFMVFWMFFAANYGAFILLVPAVLKYNFERKTHLFLVGGIILFMILGLGGTTSLPALLFGSSWEWLTYERFNIWAAIWLLPLCGELLSKIKNRRLIYIRRTVITLLLLHASVWWFYPELESITAPMMDLKYIYKSLESDPLCQERYLALGFGHQLALLSAYTNAKTLDGLWHTARSDPLLRSSGIGSLSDAVYWNNGRRVLAEFLMRDQPIPAYCIYVNNASPNADTFREIISAAGWYWERNFPDNISIWRNNRFNKLIDGSAARENITLKNYVWGIFPVIFLVGAIVSSVASAFWEHNNP